MFTIYDLAEVGAGFASFFTFLFVLVRRAGRLSANLYVIAAFLTTCMWVAFVFFVSSPAGLSQLQHGILTAFTSVAIGLWLLFLRVFAREPLSGIIGRRALPLYPILSLLLLSAVAGFFIEYYTLELPDQPERAFVLTPVGKYLLTLYVVAFTFGLLQIESTFRASTGQTRRSIFLPSVVTALLLITLVIVATLGLLFTHMEFVGIRLSALLMIASLILLSRFVVFEERRGQGVVLSRAAVYSSVTVLLVGAYLILIGVVIRALVSLGGSPHVFLSVLAAFVVIVVFVALLLSGSIRTRWRNLVDRTFYSDRTDVLTELSTFAEDVTAATDRSEMFAAIVSILESKCGMTEVKIALRGEREGEFYWSFPQQSADAFVDEVLDEWLLRAGKLFRIDTFLEKTHPHSSLAATLGEILIPLVARKQIVGFITCTSRESVGGDIRFLIDSISHQLALSLLTARQSEVLLETREMASFVKVSSFVIHDVKNLISMVSMILQNFETKSEDPRFQQVTMETLRSALERMQRLINRLASPPNELDFPLSDCDPKEIVVDLIAELRLSSNPKYSVIVDLNSLPRARANTEKLKSVLSNLIINALESMPNGGELRINAQAEPAHVLINVSDTGTGMSAAFIRERLFRPFQTSKKGGLGIGLFQSRELVELMGGRLTVESAPRRGSCFTVKLVRSEQEE